MFKICMLDLDLSLKTAQVFVGLMSDVISTYQYGFIPQKF